jgi:hypothetical protein
VIILGFNISHYDDLMNISNHFFEQLILGKMQVRFFQEIPQAGKEVSIKNKEKKKEKHICRS